MSNLEVKHVSFMGADLMAAKDENGTIWAGVSYICNGLGLNKAQKDNQIEKIRKDTVLFKGCRKFPAGVFDPNNITYAVKLDFVPLWLAKINITQTMQTESPELAARLEAYQLKAKDVLAEAFLPPQQMQLSDAELMAKALLVAQKTIEAREARISELSEQNTALLTENEQQKCKIQQDKPLVEFAEHVSQSVDSINMATFAKLLHDENIKIGRNRLFAWMKKNKYLMQSTKPYQKYVDAGYFDLVERPFETPYGKKHVYTQTLVTGKGQIYFTERLRKEFGKR